MGVTAGGDPDAILIWGAGAVGGTIGAHLARAGHPVVLVDVVAEHVAAIREHGLAIEGPIAAFTQRAPAFTPGELSGRYRRCLLCVKAHHTAAAAAAMRPFVADDGYVVSAQNGLNERAIAEIVGRERTIGAFVNFGADYLAPGRVLYGGRGAVVIGELDGRTTPRLVALHALLRDFEPAAIATDNIWGYLWGKLAYGALLFATALTHDSIADALALPRHFALYRALGAEILAVAAAERVRPEGFNGFDPAAFEPGADPAATRRSIDEMVAHNRRSAKSHSGIWRDLAVRKRRTEVDAQLAVIAEIAAGHGLATPRVERLVRLVHDIEDGRRAMERANLDLIEGDDPSSRPAPAELRTAVEADYPAVASAIQSWWTLPGLDTAAAARERAALVPRLWLQHFAGTSLIAERDGRLVGFLIGFLSQDRAAEGYIHFVGVAPDQRGRGVGRLLYERFFALCRGAGRSHVRCVTSPTNTLSIAFHEAMGFEIERRGGEMAKPDYDGPGVPRVAFVRSTAATG